MKERRRHPRLTTAKQFVTKLLQKDDIPKENTTLIGHIDFAAGGKVTGWAVDLSSTAKNLQIDLVSNGKVIGYGTTSVPRADLKNLGYGHGRHGFHISINPGFYFNATSKVKLRESDTGKSIRSNAFSLAPSEAIDAEITRSDATSITGSIQLREPSGCPFSVILQSPTGEPLTSAEQCEFTTTPGTDLAHVLFEISTTDLDQDNVTEYRLHLLGCKNSAASTTYKYSPNLNRYKEFLREIFFAPYYLYSNNISDVSVDNAFEHYITQGVFNDLNPNPWVDSAYIRQQNSLVPEELPVLFYISSEHHLGVNPSVLFSPDDYREANPDIGTYSPLMHYCKYGINQNRPTEKKIYGESVLNDIRQTSLHEPDIAFHDEVVIHQCPNYHKGTFLTELVTNYIGIDTEILVCVPFLSVGGADYISTRLATVLASQIPAASITILVTDTDNMSGAHWIPEGVNLVVLENLISGLPIDDKVPLIHKAIANIAPSKIINVNSHVCWQIFDDYGRFLSQYTELYAYIFCFDYDANDRPVGYVPTYLEDTIQYLSGVISDNQKFIDDICTLYGYSDYNASKFKCAYTPVEDNLPRWQHEPSAKKVLWCGRLGRQKNIDLLVAISRILPDVTFEIFGPGGDSEHSSAIISGQYKNLVYRGVYKNFSELKFNEYGAFLYTANWDGLPTVLINMMGIGVPVISSDIGGIHELLNDTNSVLVPEDASASDYAKELARLLFIEENIEGISTKAIEQVNRVNSHEQYHNAVLSVVFTTEDNLKVDKTLPDNSIAA